MEVTELLRIVARGEDSRHQFKRDSSNPDSLAQEFVAFSNSGGGFLIIGVDDDGTVVGLSADDVQRLDNQVSNSASQHMDPPCNPRTEIVEVEGERVMVVEIEDGLRKPYTANGVIVVKCGADKRRVTAPEEMQRMFQRARLLHGDEVPVAGTTVSDVDRDYFREFVVREFGESAPDEEPTRLLNNMNLMRGEALTTAAVILLGKSPAAILPEFITKAVAFPGTSMEDNTYLDSRDITGRIGDVFTQTLSFCLSHTPTEQNDQSVNSLGDPVVPRIVFEELIANALLHRDYFISAPIRVLLFKDRAEIVSPGHLPNNLT